jgi:hypothetical protein
MKIKFASFKTTTALRAELGKMFFVGTSTVSDILAFEKEQGLECSGAVNRKQFVVMGHESLPYPMDKQYQDFEEVVYCATKSRYSWPRWTRPLPTLEKWLMEFYFIGGKLIGFKVDYSAGL